MLFDCWEVEFTQWKRMGKKRGIKTEPVIPTNLKANITSKMRAENEIVETFDNAILPALPAPAVMKKITADRQRAADVVLTAANDVHTFEADVIRTYSQSSGSVSYDSRNSLRSSLMSDAQMIKNNVERKMTATMESVSQTPIPPKMHLLNDVEMNRMISGRVLLVEAKEMLPPPLALGQHETQFTKRLIKDIINQYFENTRDDIDLMLQISRRGAYPRVHVELKPSEELTILSNSSKTPFAARGSSLQSSAPIKDMNMPSTAQTDLATVNSPYDGYLRIAYAYLTAFCRLFAR
uniref:Uncharacterized protein n=1 Tax=Parascaris univalens TaxID=6257 RepID=A0A915BXV1_PARUN